MELKDLLEEYRAALVEYYDDSPACETANQAVEAAAKQLEGVAGVMRVNVGTDPKEGTLAHITVVPTIIIYRHHREERRIEGSVPTAAELVEWTRASADAPGAEFHHRPGYEPWMRK